MFILTVYELLKRENERWNLVNKENEIRSWNFVMSTKRYVKQNVTMNLLNINVNIISENKNLK